MKEILIRLFAHEELSHEEACNLMKGITRGDYNEAQIASLLTVFQMRGVKVNELTGFREALLTTRVPVDFSDFQPIDIVGTGGDGKNTFKSVDRIHLTEFRLQRFCCYLPFYL